MDVDQKEKTVANGSEMLFATNFFRVYYKSVDVNSINVYNCELSTKDERIRVMSKYKVIRQILDDHFQNINHAYIYSHGLLFMVSKKEENEAGIQSLRYDAKVILKHVDTLNDNIKIARFLLRYIERVLVSFKLMCIDDKYYDIQKLFPINEFGISVMNGFHPNIVPTEKGFALLFDLAYKVIKTESIYEYIKKTYTSDADIAKIKKELIGKAVLTKYNCRLYTIKDVDFTKKIKTEIIMINSHAYTFKEYYASKYNISIAQNDQPLLLVGHKNKTNTYLLPELCYLIGISKEMLKDFKMLKLVYSFYKQPPEYLLEIHSIIKKINDSPFVKNWGIYFSTNGDIVKGNKLNSGNLLLRNSRVAIDSIQSFERELQKGMIASPSLAVWGLIYSSKHKNAKDSLLNEIQSIVTVLQIPCKPPKLVEIPNDELNTWMEQIKSIPSNVEALIILIPGNKNAKFSLYSNLKGYFLLNKNTPTQFLMASTIERGKNLKSICYKVITQLSTKLGGIPWEIEPLQFTDRPLMVIGISNQFIAPYHVTSICATIDKKLSRYTSCVVSNKIDANIQNKILQMLNTFKLTVGDYPHHIIIYREGTIGHSKGKLLTKQINDFLQVFKIIGREGMPYTVVLVDRKTAAKQFHIKKTQDGSIEVKIAAPGSLISNGITEKDVSEFYLTSCKSNNKAPPLTHYQCYHVDYIKEDMSRSQYLNRLQDLTFKLCFLYYNNSGSISIPAPLKYSIRLIKLIQDISMSDVVVPKVYYEVTNGLYFI